MIFFLTLLVRFLYANLLEYAIHRWAEHGPLWETNHKNHHEDPETPTLFLHTGKGAVALAALITSSAALFSFWGFWSSLIFFLLYYLLVIEGAHYVAHRFHISRHHMKHHADLQEGNFNVWIPLGDFLFGTRIK